MKHALFAQEWVKDERLRRLFYQDAFYLCILFVRWNFACWYSNEEDFKMLYFFYSVWIQTITKNSSNFSGSPGSPERNVTAAYFLIEQTQSFNYCKKKNVLWNLQLMWVISCSWWSRLFYLWPTQAINNRWNRAAADLFEVCYYQ
jgi:hypothetical protein